MKTAHLVIRSLTYYWRTNLAVVLGVAMAVAVLAGALLVGDSVRASLRSLFLNRLGATDFVITSPLFFREILADELTEQGDSSELVNAACPIIALESLVTHEPSGQRSSQVSVYGVDERFWKFHQTANAPSLGEREILLTQALVQELGATAGDTILLRVGKPSETPADSLHGQKEDLGRTLRLTAKQWPQGSSLEEFALYPHQGRVRAVFVSLRRLQRDLEQQGRVNSILLSQMGNDSGDTAPFEKLFRQTFQLEDVGVTLRWLEQSDALSVESESILLNEALVEAARNAAENQRTETVSVFTYLANTMRVGDRETPYSLVTAVDANGFERLGIEPSSEIGAKPIFLNEWAFRDLNAKVGDPLTMEYYIWQESGRLSTENAAFQIAGSVALKGEARDPDWAPVYPGITESLRLVDWDPTFPVDFDRIRQRDEDYWDRYRTTPKAFVPLSVGQNLWGSPYGELTSIRVYEASDIEAFETDLRNALDPARLGITLYPARSEGLQASRGAVDFSEYFTYFSFFLVVSSLLLTGLFFKLGVEQRTREIGLLNAVGFPPKGIRALFVREGAVLAVLGSLVGLFGAAAYAWLIMLGLKTWWVDSVGTTLLTLHVSPSTLALGGVGGVIAALLAIVGTLRGLRPVTPRQLLTGDELKRAWAETHRPLLLGATAALLSLVLVVSTLLGGMNQVAGFFGAGSLLLVALLSFQWSWLRRKDKSLLAGSSPRAIARLGLRNATHRPGRSLLSIALMAFASFIIVAVDAFRRDTSHEPLLDVSSGNGGYSLLAESLLPLYYDPNTQSGKEALNLPTGEDSPLSDVDFVPFRVRPGEDTSCLNMYRPSNPQIMAVPEKLIESRRFRFQSSLAETDEEEQNPWLLLTRPPDDGTIPVIADANSATYVLHLKLGEELAVPRSAGEPLRLKLVATLSDSLFQSELLMSESNFRRVFPDENGFRFFLIDAKPQATPQVTEVLEQRLGDFGFDVVTTHERIADFHRVENTYLSTFQSLGGLGLILGTLGLTAVMLRNILERRRELALLRAVGYHSNHVALMVIAENALLLLGGVVTGTVCALIAIAPAIASRGGGYSLPSVGLLLLAVLASGVVSSLIAVWASVRSPLLESLRTE